VEAGSILVLPTAKGCYMTQKDDDFLWHLMSEFPLNVKTSTQICSVFGGMLIECKNLQGLSDKEMSAYVSILFFKMPHITFNFVFLVG
jgi:hypothetical protein